MDNNKIVLFQEKKIRRIWHKEAWWFSIVDIVSVLSDSPTPSKYWEKVKKRMKTETLNDLSPNWGKLKLQGADGKNYPTDCANTEGVFRIIMSIPSPKAEPLRLWLAEQGRRTIEEVENPELLTQRQIEIYKTKGYSDEWINNRIESIKARKRLTDEWKGRGVKEGTEYSILTATIAKGTFGMTPSEHKDYKGLSKPNEELRDHMTPLELIFTALGEELTRQEAIREDAQGFNENHDAAIKGGSVAGKYRKDAEKKGYKVLSKENYLPKSDETKNLPKKKTDKTD